MKKTALIFIFIFILSFINTTNAQWYYSSCGVTDINNCTPEEFECLWEGATGRLALGIATTTLGTSFIVAGIIKSRRIEGIDWDEGSKAILLTTIGVIIDAVGIPLIITGAHRRFELKSTPNYKTLNIESSNISPKIGVNQFNNSRYYGLSLSLNF